MVTKGERQYLSFKKLKLYQKEIKISTTQNNNAVKGHGNTKGKKKSEITLKCGERFHRR